VNLTPLLKNLTPLLVIVLIAAAAVAGYYFQQQGSSETGNQANREAEASGDTAANVELAPAGDQAVAARDVVPISSRQVNHPRLDDNIDVLVAATEVLFEKAEAGLPTAQYEVARLLESCGGLLDDSFLHRLRYLEGEGRPAWYVDRLNKDANACRHLPFHSLQISEPSYWLEQAKNSGDPAALAEYLGLVADVKDLSGADALASQVMLARNGDAYYELMPYLVHRDKQMGVYDEEFDAARGGALLRLACHFGFRECEPGSRMVFELCVNAVPMCVPDMGILEYMQNFEWTSGEAQLNEVLFQQYLEAIERGDTSPIFADN